MIWLDVDTAVTIPVNVAALTDDTDFKTKETAIVYNSPGMTLTWNFLTSAGVYTGTSVTPTVASGTGAGNDYDWEQIGSTGMYSVDLPASGGASVNNDAEGYGWFEGVADGVLPWRGPTFGFRAAGLNNLLVDDVFSATRGLTGTALPAVVAEGAGGIYTRGSGAGQINQPANGAIDVNAVSAIAAFFQDCFTVDSGEVSGAEVSGSLILEIVKVAWDRVLTGATHNIASSAGRRLRGVQAFGDYANGALWFDSVNGVGGQVNYENATVQNPSNSLTDVLAIATSLKMVRIEVAPGSTLTLDAVVEGFSIRGENWTLALGSQSVSGTYVQGAHVSGIGTGASHPHFYQCHFGTTSLPPFHFEYCGIEDILTLTGAGDYFLDHCHGGTVTPIIDYEDAAENKNVYVEDYSGALEIRNIGQAGSTDTLHLSGRGELIFASTCEAATVTIEGNFTITDNVGGGGFVGGAGGTLNDDARLDVAQITKTGYDGGAVWIDTNASNTNTVSFIDGTVENPVSTIAAATTIAGNVNIKRFYLVPGSNVTLAQAYDNYIFDACHSTIALGGQSVNNVVFIGAVITGNDDGSNTNHVQYFDCVIGGNTLGQFVMTRCYLTAATLTLAQAGTYYMHQCFSGVAGTSTPTVDFGSGLNASNLNMRDYSGGIEIENMGKGTGNYNMSLEGNGQLVINANSTADGGGISTVAIRGNFTVTDNASGAVALSDNARFDVDQINAECDSALSDYDGPTNTEMVAAFTEIKGATWASGDDTLEAIRDRGDAAWVTGNTTVPDAAGTAAGLHTTTDALINGLTDIDAAGVRTAVGLASADLDAQLGAIKSDLPSKPTKGVAISGFQFFMVLTSDHVTGGTGLTVTPQRSINGGAFAGASNAVSEIGNGVYKIDLSASDMNGDTVCLKFTAATADARIITILTQPT